jgi:hypothetical protein
MYTVIRFSSSTVDDPKLGRLATNFNKRFPGLFTGLDKGTMSFSCSVAEDGTWSEHSNAIGKMLRDARTLVNQAARLQIAVCFDTALEAEDFENVNLLSLPLDKQLLSALAAAHAEFEFSAYVMNRKRTNKKAGSAKKTRTRGKRR